MDYTDTLYYIKGMPLNKRDREFLLLLHEEGLFEKLQYKSDKSLYTMRKKLNYLFQRLKGNKEQTLVGIVIHLVKKEQSTRMDIEEYDRPADASDHALIRYFERIHGLDFSGLRSFIQKQFYRNKIAGAIDPDTGMVITVYHE